MKMLKAFGARWGKGREFPDIASQKSYKKLRDGNK